MARLHDQLKYFIKEKISTDPLWSNVKVILSGHEVRTHFFNIIHAINLLIVELEQYVVYFSKYILISHMWSLRPYIFTLVCPSLLLVILPKIPIALNPYTVASEDITSCIGSS